MKNAEVYKPTFILIAPMRSKRGQFVFLSCNFDLNQMAGFVPHTDHKKYRFRVVCCTTAESHVKVAIASRITVYEEE